MTLQLGDTAPDFSVDATTGRIDFHRWLGDHWGILFSHPRDFTPVCTTEIAAMARLRREFEARHVKVIALSGDTVQSHQLWSRDVLVTQGVPITFPIIADLDRRVAKLYGMLHPNYDDVHTVRTVFVIDPDKKIRLTLTYPQSCGRNFDEILRVVDALQRADDYAVSTPANWQPGDDVFVAHSLSDAEAHTRFPNGWRADRPYLRVTPDPHTSLA